ncbi:MAG: VanZ family protein [Candidatus Aminicenantes bacterium]|nr:VanZ family protein [Candidatus Aminicenantes bacterium]
MKNKLRQFFPAAAFGVFMLVMATIPTQGIKNIEKIHPLFRWILSDYVLHFSVFVVFTLLLCHAYRRLKFYPFPFARIAFFSIAFGLYIEIYQLLIPYRSFSLKDLGADIAGTAAALILYFFLTKGKSRNTSKA